MKAQELWNEYKMYDQSVSGDDYEAWSFGGDPDGLLKLVMSGIKTATASAYGLYALYPDEKIPEPGDYSVILDSTGEAHCVIKTTRIEIVEFKDVSAEHAFKEGEGDRSLACWRKAHESFFKEDANELPFDEHFLVLCEEFDVVYTGENTYKN